MALLCLLLTCCQKVDLTTEPENTGTAGNTTQTATIVGTGEGTMERPYTVTDIRTKSLPANEAVWVIGYMVGTAHRAMSNAVFSTDTDNQSNILLASDATCTDTEQCIPVELSTEKLRKSFSLPANVTHFQKCLLVNGKPAQYLYKKGLRNVSAGFWFDDFDISSVAPQEWEEQVIICY